MGGGSRAGAEVQGLWGQVSCCVCALWGHPGQVPWALTLPPFPPTAPRFGSVLRELELTLDGAIVSVVFHDSMDMGVVGTTAGTLWFISWAEGSSTHLISGHRSKVRPLGCWLHQRCPGGLQPGQRPGSESTRSSLCPCPPPGQSVPSPAQLSNGLHTVCSSPGEHIGT